MKRAFTLIEVMVVIAIIGVLSSILIRNLNESRLKANSARIKLEMSSIRRAAAIYYENQNPNSYGGNANNCYASGPDKMFANDIVLVGLISSIDSISDVDMECRAGTSGGLPYFVVSANLVGVSNPNEDNWCVDSKGISKAIPNPIDNAATACP